MSWWKRKILKCFVPQLCGCVSEWANKCVHVCACVCACVCVWWEGEMNKVPGNQSKFHLRQIHWLFCAKKKMHTPPKKKMRERERTWIIFKDSSLRSIWTYVTASPCYTTNTNKHDYTTNRYYMNKQLINAVSQSSYKWAETCIQQYNFLPNMWFKQIRPRERERERERENMEILFNMAIAPFQGAQ